MYAGPGHEIEGVGPEICQLSNELVFFVHSSSLVRWSFSSGGLVAHTQLITRHGCKLVAIF